MWDQIRSNQRRSALVMLLLALLLLGTGAALGVVVSGRESGAVSGAAIGAAVWLVLFILAATSGDKMMLSLAGARRIQKQHHPRLFNIVEEMTIAAGLPVMPAVYIVEDPSPNAFATGKRPDRAAVTVTTGLLRELDRDELQGVVAHELGHIKNLDIRLLTYAGVMLGSIVVLSEAGSRLLRHLPARSRRSSNKSGDPTAVVYLVAVIFIILAPILAQFLYFSLSRRREYLADASGAMFTRYPEGLARALEKIAAPRASRLRDQSRVTAPLYIHQPRGNARAGASSSFQGSSLFSTHPPIRERIKILRKMGGGAGFDAYAKAAMQVSQRSIIGASTLKAAAPVAAREGVSLHSVEDSEVRKTREAYDAVFSAEGYQILDCPCGARVKIPPSLQGHVHQCVRCDRPLQTR